MSRPTRWTVRAACLSLLAAPALLAPPAALAVDGGFDPTVTPPVYPGTTTPINGWKLTGTGAATNVQVSTRWVISSAHGGLGIGNTYRSPTGQTSTVVDYAQPAQALADGSRADISVSLLKDPIAAPSGGFPYLLTEAITADLQSALPGYVLWSGHGSAPAPGTPRVGWAKPDGLEYPGSSNLAHVGGDSGSTGFLYRYPFSRPVMPGVVDYASDRTPTWGGNTRFADALKPATTAPSYATVTDWLKAQLAKHPEAPAPSFSTFSGAGLSLTSLKPMAPRNLAVTSAAPSWVRLSWKHADDTRVPRTSYRLRVSPSGRVISLPATTTSYAVTGLTAGTNYTFGLKAVNANGESNVARRRLAWTVPSMTNADLIEPDSVSYKVRANPGAISGLTLTGERANGSNTTEYGGGKSGTDYCVVAKWSAATNPPGAVVTRYAVTINGVLVPPPTDRDGNDSSATPGADGRFTMKRCGLQANTNQVVAIQPFSDLNPGPITNTSINTPTGAPAGTPFPAVTALAGETRRAVKDGKVDYCAAFTWQTPTPLDGFPLTGYNALIHTSNYSYIEGFDDLTTASRSKEICGLNADREYKFTVYAEHQNGSAPTAEVYVETPTGAPRGTVLGQVTQLATKPYARNSNGKVDYCVTTTWAAPATVAGFPVEDYQLLIHDGGYGYVKGYNGILPGGNTRSVDACGLAAGEEYTVTVFARFRVSATEIVASSRVISATTPSGAAPGTLWGKPQGVAVALSTEAGEQCATVSWSAPVAVEGFPVRSYSVLLHSSNYTYVVGSDVLDASARSFKECGLPRDADLKTVVFASYTDQAVTAGEAFFETPAA